MKEIWKDVKGYEGLYQVSNLGNVKSLSRERYTGGILKERLLTKRYDKRGYVQYVLYKDGIKKSFKAHHLVFETFGHGKRNGRIVNIDHIDGVKDNNNINNLQLLTNRENLAKGQLKRNKSSKFTGVYKPKNSNYYQSYITINGKHKFLGSFKTEIEAHNAYLNAIPKCEKL